MFQLHWLVPPSLLLSLLQIPDAVDKFNWRCTRILAFVLYSFYQPSVCVSVSIDGWKYNRSKCIKTLTDTQEERKEKNATLYVQGNARPFVKKRRNRITKYTPSPPLSSSFLISRTRYTCPPCIHTRPSALAFASGQQYPSTPPYMYTASLKVYRSPLVHWTLGLSLVSLWDLLMLNTYTK